MNLFSRTEQEKRSQSFSKNKKTENVLGELSGLSLPFLEGEKNDLNRKKIINQLDIYKKSPVRLLQEASKVLQKLNRTLIKRKQREECAELIASYIYPVILFWYEKYQDQENSLPESNERRTALIASIEATQQLSISYKLLFRDFYSKGRKKHPKLTSHYAARSLELIRIEQRLLALRYQKLSKVSWQHCNQLFFSQVHHSAIDDEYELIGLIAIRNHSDKLRPGGMPMSSIRKIYLSIQLFGLLDVTTWPTRMFHVPDAYLDLLAGKGLSIIADNGNELCPGFLLTYYKNETPPVYKRNSNFSAPLIQFSYTNLYNVLVEDHKELAAQQFLNVFDDSKFSRPLAEMREVDRVPVVELMIMGLTQRERRQKRHASFDDCVLSVYFSFYDVNRLLTDFVARDQVRVKESRQFIDTLAMSSALLANEQESHLATSWTVTNFSTGGLLISTEETAFSKPIQIDMLVSFSMPGNKQHPILGFVRRLNRTNTKQVEIAIVRLSNYAEAAGVQDQDELGSSTAKAVILIKDVRGEWNLIVKTRMSYSNGQPLKLIRANGSSLPVRLGNVVYAKKDFKVFELRSPGLEVAK